MNDTSAERVWVAVQFVMGPPARTVEPVVLPPLVPAALPTSSRAATATKTARHLPMRSGALTLPLHHRHAGCSRSQTSVRSQSSALVARCNDCDQVETWSQSLQRATRADDCDLTEV